MSLSISPQIEARLFDYARLEGIDPTALLEKMVKEYQPIKVTQVSMAQPVFTAANDPLMARLEARLASVLTDPEEIRKADEDMNELMRNMNANRAATGERIPFPDVK